MTGGSRSSLVVGVVVGLLGWPIASRADPEPLVPTRFYFRFGILRVVPDVSSRDFELVATGIARLVVGNGPIAGAGVRADAVTLPAAILGYVLPVLGGRLSLETIVGTPTTLTLHPTGTLANQSLAPTALGLPTGIPALGSELAESHIVPPVVTVVFRVHDFGPVTPILGAGVAALFAYGERITNPVLTAVSQPEFSIASTVGGVLQAGVDARLWGRVRARLDVKYIAFLPTDATVKDIQVHTDLPLLSTVDVGDAKVTVAIRPVIVQLGIGADF
jgi:hypothetical protein